jgi:hypothetical protein
VDVAAWQYGDVSGDISEDKQFIRQISFGWYIIEFF